MAWKGMWAKDEKQPDPHNCSSKTQLWSPTEVSASSLNAVCRQIKASGCAPCLDGGDKLRPQSKQLTSRGSSQFQQLRESDSVTSFLL